MPNKPLTFEEKREMVWSDYSQGLISQERADEMLREIGEDELADIIAADTDAL